MKKNIKKLVPPIIIDLMRSMRPQKYGWLGDFESWDEVQKLCDGYDQPNIFEKVKSAMEQVRDGKAAYERDSVLFDDIQYSWPLLAGLMYVSACNMGKLRVLDFGGSLGSSYFQNKKFLDGLSEISWSIVEQKHFVLEGVKNFQDEHLKFYYDVRSCCENEHPNVLLLLSVLQYFEKPYELLDDILSYYFDYIIIDRTQFVKAGKEKIKQQLVNPSIYEASYPCWFFNYENLLKFLENKNYQLIEEFDSEGQYSRDYSFKGMIMKRIKDE